MDVVKSIFLTCVTVLLFLPILAGSQEAEDGGSTSRNVFAPFVSRLEVMPQGEDVALTWRDSPDLESGYQVLRSREPITSANYQEARVAGRVPAGQENFADRPGIPGEYFYAVAAETPAGTIYPIFIPFRNTTANPVTVEPGPPPEERATQVTDIESEVVEDTVSISYESSKPGRNLVVYRSTDPFDSLEVLARATRLGTVPSREENFADYPVPGVRYYYGVFDSELVALGLVDFEPAENVTPSAVGVPLAAARRPERVAPQRTMRQRPLPLLSVNREIETGRLIGTQRQPPLPEPQELSSETVDALGPLRGAATESQDEAPRLVVLPEERVAVDKGPAFTLATIVSGSLERGDWEEGEELLINFLSLPLSDALAARSHFYLGQSHFFQGDYRTAFMEFLLARELYFAATEPWLDETLQRLDQ